MKQELIKYLQAKQTTFTVGEIQQVINVITALEEPKEKEKKEDKKKDGKTT